MIIKFKQEKEDVYSFTEYHYWFAPERKFYRVRKYLLLPLLAILFLFYETSKVDPDIRGAYFLNLAFVVGVVIIGYIILLKGLVKSILRRNTDKLLKRSRNEEMLGEKEFEFREDMIIVKSLHSEGVMDWGAIEKIRSDDRYYYLYQNALMAIVIPKQSVNDHKEFERLLKIKEKDWR